MREQLWCKFGSSCPKLSSGCNLRAIGHGYAVESTVAIYRFPTLAVFRQSCACRYHAG